MRRIAPLLALPMLLLSGCRIESGLTIEVRADGSGVLRAEVGYDAAAAAFLEEPSTGDVPLRGILLAGFRDVTEEEEDRGDLHFVVATVEADDLAAAFRLMATGPTDLLHEFRINRTRDRLSLNGRADLGTIMDRVAAASPAGAPLPSVTAYLTLVVPGEILVHNADTREGNTLTWALPADGEEIEIRAVTDPTRGRSFPLWLSAGIAVLVLTAIGAIVLRGGRRPDRVPPPPPPPEVLTP